jgi:hypothetical protein
MKWVGCKSFFLMLFFFAMNSYSQNNTGCISGNCNNGKGTYKFTNGSIYVGEFVKNHLEGFGKLTDANGNVYTGDFQNDKFNGKGMFERTDGTKYIGEFKDGKRNGLGTQYYSESYKEKGKWENDRFIEKAEFEEFKIEEPYSFCQALFSIIFASGDNFKEIKGENVSAYIKDEYYCTLSIKELTTVSIQDQKGYSGTYFKGTKTDAQQKWDELNGMIKKCFNEGCYKVQLQLQNGINEKVYEYLILSASGNCDMNAIGSRVRVVLTTQQNAGDVSLSVIQKQP